MTDESLMVGFAARARGLVTDGRRALLGITGAPGAGKSTFAAAVAERVRDDGTEVAVIPMDGFHLSQAALEESGTRDAMGRIDTFDARGYLELLERLRDDPERAITAPAFDRDTEEPRADAIEVGPEVELVITEGNYLLDDEAPWPQVRAILDEVWFVETDDVTRMRRLLARHVQFGKTDDEAHRWMERVDEPNARRILERRDDADLKIEAAVTVDPPAPSG